MSFRDILLHVDGQAEGLIAIGRDLAAVFGAHLTGLHVVAFPFDQGHPWAHEIPSDVLQSQAAITDAMAEDAQRCFTRTVGPIACTWRREDGNPGLVIARAARAYDLVVIGGLPRMGGDRLAASPTEYLVLAAGVPVLVLPGGERTGPLGRRVMVAWNGSREAARAVHDAAPLLRRADSVCLFEVASERRPTKQSQRSLSALRSRLELQGVPVDRATSIEQSKNEGQTLLSDAEDWQADLIVMGAYGHARIAELALGGVTRHMLAHAEIPLFMSH